MAGAGGVAGAVDPIGIGRLDLPDADHEWAGRLEIGGKRVGRDEALALVKATPGITIPEIAEKMGIKQNYLYRVVPGLAEDGSVVKDGRGWKPKDPA